jgi:hypothetical protein
MNNKFGYSIFGELNNEKIPYYFTEIFPTGITNGSAMVYLDDKYLVNKLSDIITKAITSVKNPAHVQDDFKWMISFFKVLKVELTEDEFIKLNNMNEKPECYRFIWINGWETPDSNKRKVFI